MVLQLKLYVKVRCAYIDCTLLNDSSAPATPKIVYAGPPNYPSKSLSFKCSLPTDVTPARFAALKWRIAEVDPPKKFTEKPAEPGHYEITPAWESSELTEFKEGMSVPPEKVKPGHTYR